jgi:hypothetical protein
VLLVLTGAGLGAMLLSPWQSQTRAAETAGEPEVKVEDISTLPRVPIYREEGLATNEKSVTVTLWPSPLPAGKKVTVDISKWESTVTGGATFSDGTTSKDITETTILIIRGTANSSIKDNMNLAATYEGKELAKRTFTVSTWPYDMETTLNALNLKFGLKVNVKWKSESGRVTDLTNVRWQEYVNYTTVGTNPPFNQVPTPPVSFTYPPDPGFTMTDDDGDIHDYQKSWVDWSTKTPGSRVAGQQYRFRDQVLLTAWEDGVLGIAAIARGVAPDPDPEGTYLFGTVKAGTGTFCDGCLETP